MWFISIAILLNQLWRAEEIFSTIQRMQSPGREHDPARKKAANTHVVSFLSLSSEGHPDKVCDKWKMLFLQRSKYTEHLNRPRNALFASVSDHAWSYLDRRKVCDWLEPFHRWKQPARILSAVRCVDRFPNASDRFTKTELVRYRRDNWCKI